MAYSHSEPHPYFHDWKNYAHKGAYNPVPHFNFPVKPTTAVPLPTTFIPEATTLIQKTTALIPETTTLIQKTTALIPETTTLIQESTTLIPDTTTLIPEPTSLIPETTTLETVTTFFQDIVTSAAPAGGGAMTESSVTSTMQNDIVNTAFTDMVGLTPSSTFAEATSSNSSMISDIMVNTTSSSITDLMQNGSMPMNVGQNGTDPMGTMVNDGTILTTVSEIVSSTAENTVSIISSTTEKAVTFVTEVVNNISSSTASYNHDNNHGHAPHYYAMGSHRTLYVILLVIIAILILIGIILLLIYIRYRKNSFRIMQNYYEVSPMKERTPSDNGVQEQKQCPPEMFMHYQC